VQSRIWAKNALTPSGWQSHVLVDIDATGKIVSLQNSVGNPPHDAQQVEVLLPAMANLHSHAFQRAMAGLAERSAGTGQDSFWSWRDWMYRFLQILQPEDLQAIAAMVQMQMLQAGFAAVAEFHYLHHQTGGQPYECPAEMSQRIMAAAAESGIGLTLLPVLYQVGGCDGRPLAGGQLRFGCQVEQYLELHREGAKFLNLLPPDCRIGVAPHSLRATTVEGLQQAVELAATDPIHLHLAEQVAEVEELIACRGRRPVEWLFDHFNPTNQWCLIHCTQLLPHEITSIAQSQAVVGLCPITEANLGDGIFPAVEFLRQGGRWGIGSDSNVRISLTEELRILEYSQRLRDRNRLVIAAPEFSNGRVLYQSALAGGSQALGRESGSLTVGNWADLVSLSLDRLDPIQTVDDQLLDRWIFVNGDQGVDRVWSAGRLLVQGGIHIHRETIEQKYRQTIRGLLNRL